MRIAILGAGSVGGALGRGWSRAGHRIAYGVPKPEDPKHAAAAQAAGGADVASVGQAAAGAEAIALAVPWPAVPEAVAACGALAGRILIDVTNPLRMGAEGLELALGFDCSGAETVAGLATGALVFKAMNQVGFEVMADSAGFPAPPVMFVAGDDAAAKPVVLGLVRDLGFEALDAGGLKLARLLEPYAMLWIHQVVDRGAPRDSAFAFMRRRGAL
jgi:8-hydroxy-5-deazaflavin:NADPH oxidoreductase